MKKLNYEKFMEREVVHAPYERELSFYEWVKQGDVEKIRKWADEMEGMGSEGGMGVLSQNPVRNISYHIIISIAMITRFCIEGGMDPETAYGLSDMYIQTVDETHSIPELNSLLKQLCMDYARRMQKLKKEKVYSKNVVKCIDYIYQHIGERITAQMLADHCGLHVNYLSRLFKKEMGQTISEYIRRCKIDTAKNMLKYSSYSYSDIAAGLAFSSQSHFTHVFREETKMTPRQYRDHYYRTNWGEEK